jgi:4'-phosphopantetheinyl transferase
MKEPEGAWRLPPPDLALSDGAVHIWRASLNPPTGAALLHYSLAADELRRAARFYGEHDRRRFIIARGVLRAILSRYLNVAAGRLGFWYSPYGKPALAPTPDQAPLSFNVTHSHELALYAITRGRRIGIDLEYIRPDVTIMEIADQFFAPPEVAALRALPAAQRQAAFFACWTRKEAYVKARGEGLSYPLDQFDVSVTPGAPTVRLDTQQDPQEAAGWSLYELHVGPNYQATVAVEGQNCCLSYWQWPE